MLRRQLPALLRVAQPAHAVTLAALSILEAYIVSRSERLPRMSDTTLQVYGKLPMRRNAEDGVCVQVAQLQGHFTECW